MSKRFLEFFESINIYNLQGETADAENYCVNNNCCLIYCTVADKAAATLERERKIYFIVVCRRRAAVKLRSKPEQICSEIRYQTLYRHV